MLMWHRMSGGKANSTRLLRVGFISLGDLRSLLVAFVEDETVTQLEVLVLLQFECAAFGLQLQLRQAEGIRGEKAVGARMPRCGMTEAARMIQHGDAEVLA